MFKKAQVKLKKIISIASVIKLRVAGAKVGKDVLIFGWPSVYNAQNLEVGSGVFINDGFWCNAKGGVAIRDDVIMGPGVIIHSSNHVYDDPNIAIKLQGHIDKPVVIGENVWVGARVTILPGVTVCSRVVLAAGAVVAADINIPGVYGGVPAKLIKKL